MVDPIITGAAISAGAQLLGGAFGARSASKQVRFQKQFAKRGVQWRVADAKKAGIHPLYALGANLPQYSPVHNPMGDALAAAGQNIGAAVAARQTPAQKQAENLALAQAQASLDRTYAETALLQSERLKTIMGQFQWLPEENTKEKGSMSTVFGGQAIPLSRGVPSDYITPKAPDLPSASSKDSGVIAGSPPFAREFTLPGGMPILLPGGVSGDAAEAMESVTESWPVLYSVYKMNVAKYGDAWRREFLRRYVVPSWGVSAADWLATTAARQRSYQKSYEKRAPDLLDNPKVWR